MPRSYQRGQGRQNKYLGLYTNPAIIEAIRRAARHANISMSRWIINLVIDELQRQDPKSRWTIQRQCTPQVATAALTTE